MSYCEIAYDGRYDVLLRRSPFTIWCVNTACFLGGRHWGWETKPSKKYWTILSIWIDFDYSNLTMTQQGWWKSRLGMHVALPTGHSASQMGTISTAHTLKGLFCELLEQHRRNKRIYACKLLFFKQLSIKLPILICVQGDKYWKESSLWKESSTPSRISLK